MIYDSFTCAIFATVNVNHVNKYINHVNDFSYIVSNDHTIVQGECNKSALTVAD